MDLIFTHTNTDFDALGAMMAAKHLNPRAIMALPTELNANVRRFVSVYQEAFGMVPLFQVDLAAIDRVMLVDAQDPRHCGELGPLLARAEVAWEVVDHHPLSPHLPAGARQDIHPIGAATTLMVRRLRAANAHLSVPEATAMLLGIMEDTGRLVFPSTTPEDAEAVAYLFAQGARGDQMLEYLEPPLSATQLDLLAAMLPAVSVEHLGGRRTILLGVATSQSVSGAAAVLERLMALYQPQVAIAAIQSGAHTQIVGRTRDVGLDLRRVLAPWSVAGHAAAVAGHLTGTQDLAELIEALRERLRSDSATIRRARDVMSAPVRVLTFETTVAQALEAMRTWGHSAMPVVHRERVQGVLSRRDLDRAMHHGFGDQPIKSLVPRFVAAVHPETPLAEVQDRMASLEIGRLMVLEDSRLVGIITRSDLIRELASPRAPIELADQQARLAERLEATWPQRWRDVLATLSKLAGDRPTYLVGGAVRDLLLERPSFDVDVLVEGDAIALGQELADALGGRLKAHDAFATAHVTLSDGQRVDLASSRLEHYPRPGALPVVSPGSARQDLGRRDFSINALAMRLDGVHFGEVLDCFGGQADLGAGLLRILHPISFIEDPIRIFRAARFETKLKFRMDDNTEASARYVLASGRFDRLGGERLKLELRLGLTLARVRPLIERLADLDALRMIHPDLALTPGISRALHRLDRLRPLISGDSWLLPLALLLFPLSERAREEAIAPLLLSRAEAKVLEAAWRALALTPVEIESASRAQLAHVLEGLELEVLWLLAAAFPSARARRRLREYGCELRALKLERVDGDWLLARGVPPGPLYREVLAAVLEAKREGSVANAEDEETLARSWLAARGHPV